MRLDKCLQLTRAVKRRVWAQDACDDGRVRLNGRVARAHSQVRAGDRVELDLGTVTGWRIELELLRIPERGGFSPDDYRLNRIRWDA